MKYYYWICSFSQRADIFLFFSKGYRVERPRKLRRKDDLGQPDGAECNDGSSPTYLTATPATYTKHDNSDVVDGTRPVRNDNTPIAAICYRQSRVFFIIFVVDVITCYTLYVGFV